MCDTKRDFFRTIEAVSNILLLVEFIKLLGKVVGFRDIKGQPLNNTESSTWIYPNITMQKDEDFGGCFSVKERDLEADRWVPCLLLFFLGAIVLAEFGLKIYKHYNKSKLKDQTKRIIWQAVAGLNLFSGFLNINMMWINDLNVSYCYGYAKESVYSQYFQQNYPKVYDAFEIRWKTIGLASGIILLIFFLLGFYCLCQSNKEWKDRAKILFYLGLFISFNFLFLLNVLLYFMVTILGWWTEITTFEVIEDALELIIITWEAYEMYDNYLLCLPSLYKRWKKKKENAQSTNPDANENRA